MCRKFWLIVVVAWSGILNVVASEEPEEWQFSFTPYAFGLSFSGKMATLPPAGSAEIDLGFDDIWNHLNMAYSGAFFARKGDWGFWLEGFYADLEADAEISSIFYKGIEYNLQLEFYTLGGSYAVIRDDVNDLRLVFGARYLSVKNDFVLLPGIFKGGRLYDQAEWVDPLVGVRFSHHFTDRLNFKLTALVAVFGESEEMYDLFAGGAYGFGSLGEFIVGYRHIKYDSRKGDFVFDVELSGPIIGYQFKF